MKRAKIRLHGTVQGVYFKAEIQKRAEELNIFGTAQNLLDGTVEVIVEGEEDRLRELIHWFETVEFRGKVEKIVVEWEEYQKSYDNFKILPMEG